jgi:hypothetical protein
LWKMLRIVNFALSSRNAKLGHVMARLISSLLK